VTEVDAAESGSVAAGDQIGSAANLDRGVCTCWPVVCLNSEMLAAHGANQEAEVRWPTDARMGRSRRGVAGVGGGIQGRRHHYPQGISLAIATMQDDWMRGVAAEGKGRGGAGPGEAAAATVA
jgi:hypothetical protein